MPFGIVSGLDYYAYIMRDKDKPYHFEDKDELAYGRKSWELAHMFKTDLDERCSPLAPADYYKFLIAVEEFGPEKIEDYATMSYKVDSGIETDDKVLAEFDKLEKSYIKWYNKTFHRDPPSRYDFSAGYILSFYEARYKIFNVWEHGEAVWTLAAY